MRGKNCGGVISSSQMGRASSCPCPGLMGPKQFKGAGQGLENLQANFPIVKQLLLLCAQWNIHQCTAGNSVEAKEQFADYWYKVEDSSTSSWFPRSMVYGLWSMLYGLWSIVYGLFASSTNSKVPEALYSLVCLPCPALEYRMMPVATPWATPDAPGLTGLVFINGPFQHDGLHQMQSSEKLCGSR